MDPKTVKQPRKRRTFTKEMVNPDAVMAMLVSGMTMYMMLWVLPEPVSKGIAAAMTIVLVAYVGVDTLYTLGRGWKRLVDVADKATTFEQLRDAGEEFGKVMGADTARILVMLATAAVGSQAPSMAKIGSTLPGAAQASRLAVAEGSVGLEAIGAVETVTIAEAGLTVALAPGAVAMSSSSDSFGRGPHLEIVRPTGAPEVGSLPSAESYKNVEIVDERGAPVGEFDEIGNGRFFEDKSAEGLGRINPRTGGPHMTPDEWAEAQIYDKTISRIENLFRKATATRAAPGSTAPTLDEISSIRHLTFRIRNGSPEVISAVARQLARLRAKFPDWIFDAIYGTN